MTSPSKDSFGPSDAKALSPASQTGIAPGPQQAGNPFGDVLCGPSGPSVGAGSEEVQDTTFGEAFGCRPAGDTTTATAANPFNSMLFFGEGERAVMHVSEVAPQASLLDVSLAAPMGLQPLPVHDVSDALESPTPHDVGVGLWRYLHSDGAPSAYLSAAEMLELWREGMLDYTVRTRSTVTPQRSAHLRKHPIGPCECGITSCGGTGARLDRRHG